MSATGAYVLDQAFNLCDIGSGDFSKVLGHGFILGGIFASQSTSL